MNWQTPSVNRNVISTTKKVNYQLFDQTLESARRFGIDANNVEIVPSFQENKAWFIREIERSLPTNVDSVAIHPETLKITSAANFREFNLMAKLTRWGIDFHMGNLFGVINQIILVIFCIGILYLIISGYQLWYQKNGFRLFRNQDDSITSLFKIQPLVNKLIVLIVFLSIGYWLPLFLIFSFSYILGEIIFLKISKK